MDKMRFKILSRILMFALSLLMVTALGIACAEQPACPQLDMPAPDFTLEDLNGTEVNLSDYLGENIILNFWATSCGYCRKQLPYLEQVYEKYSDKGLTVLAVNAMESHNQAANYIDEQGYTFPVLLDSNGTVNQLYCVPALPATMFIDSEGIVRFARLGAFSNVEEVENALSYFD
jgi:peroxiredoxin